MKTIMKLTLGAFMALLTLGSCKESRTENTDVDTTGATEMEMDATTTDTATVVPDTTAAGTTSGEMEQIP